MMSSPWSHATSQMDRNVWHQYMSPHLHDDASLSSMHGYHTSLSFSEGPLVSLAIEEHTEFHLKKQKSL